MQSTIVYEDEFGDVIDRPGRQLIEIRWHDTTARLDGEAFNRWLEAFATGVERARRPGVLVDALAFAMPMASMDADWRDRHIIPRYNAAGVARFAFLMPADMPAIGAPPAPVGPATFPTAYFGDRAEALAWLAGA